MNISTPIKAFPAFDVLICSSLLVVVLKMLLRTLNSTLFPYTTLFRSRLRFHAARCLIQRQRHAQFAKQLHSRWRDRKSTRLNSSHLGTSYAVFCLKKKDK